MRIRIATFNIENLASRSQFGPRRRPDTAPALSLVDAPTQEAREAVQRAIAVAQEDDKRQATALAIAEADADLLLLQEVDNLGVLQAFLANYVHALSARRYGHVHLVNGNDPRGIDVAFAACTSAVRSDGVAVTSHHRATFEELGVYADDLAALGIGPDDRVFNRDCLEVSLYLGGTELTTYVCHFKSIGEGRPDARAATRPLRRAEARAVRSLVIGRFGDRWRDALWIVGGDLNDFRERIRPGGAPESALPSGIDDLLDDFGVNPLESLPPTERWTYYSEAAGGEHVQLDRLLLSPALARLNPAPRVTLVRSGLPYRVPLDPAAPDRTIRHLATAGGRYPRIGWDRPRASDHALLALDLDLP